MRQLIQSNSLHKLKAMSAYNPKPTTGARIELRVQGFHLRGTMDRKIYPLFDLLRILRLRFSKPVVQNGLVLRRIELGDLAKSHCLRFAIGLVSQELFQLFQ
jgi:hypothetical protein